MEGGGSKVYRNNASELHFEASNMGIEGSHAAITTRRSITTDDNICGGATTATGLGSVLFKRKRGRPKKYDSNGNFIRRPNVQSPPLLPSLPLPPSLPIQTAHQQPLRHAHYQLHAMDQGMNADTTGMEFTPYVIQVSTGEDAVEKILAHFQTGPRCISILSATGTVYNVVIRHSNSCAQLLKYEGIFQILSLSGSFDISEDGKIQTGGLGVLLSCSGGHIIGGTLGGSLLAANPVQMVVASFIPTRKQKHPKKRNQDDGLRMSVVPHAGSDLEVGTSKNRILKARPTHKLQVTSHEPTPFPTRDTNDGGTSYSI